MLVTDVGDEVENGLEPNFQNFCDRPEIFRTPGTPATRHRYPPNSAREFERFT